MEKVTVTISKKEYDALIKGRDFLYTLVCHGVDNWSGYCEAYEEFEQQYGEFEQQYGEEEES